MFSRFTIPPSGGREDGSLSSYDRSRTPSPAEAFGVAHGRIISRIRRRIIPRIYSRWVKSEHLIHSAYFYSASSSSLLLKGAPDYSMHWYCVGVTVRERLAQGLYVAAGVGFEPATLRTQGTIEPPHLSLSSVLVMCLLIMSQIASPPTVRSFAKIL